MPTVPPKPTWPVRPKPIRVDPTTWLVVRNDPVLPKAIIRRLIVTDTTTGGQVERYRVVTWTLDGSGRELIGYYGTLAAADNAVRWDVAGPDDVHGGPPNGIR